MESLKNNNNPSWVAQQRPREREKKAIVLHLAYIRTLPSSFANCLCLVAVYLHAVGTAGDSRSQSQEGGQQQQEQPPQLDVSQGAVGDQPTVTTQWSQRHPPFSFWLYYHFFGGPLTQTLHRFLISLFPTQRGAKCWADSLFFSLLLFLLLEFSFKMPFFPPPSLLWGPFMGGEIVGCM